MVKATLKFYYGCDHKQALKLINYLSNQNTGIKFIKSSYDCTFHKIIFKAPCRAAVYTIIEQLTEKGSLVGTIEDIKIRGRDTKDYSKYL